MWLPGCLSFLTNQCWVSWMVCFKRCITLQKKGLSVLIKSSNYVKTSAGIFICPEESTSTAPSESLTRGGKPGGAYICLKTKNTLWNTLQVYPPVLRCVVLTCWYVFPALIWRVLLFENVMEIRDGAVCSMWCKYCTKYALTYDRCTLKYLPTLYSCSDPPHSQFLVCVAVWLSVCSCAIITFPLWIQLLWCFTPCLNPAHRRPCIILVSVWALHTWGPCIHCPLTQSYAPGPCPPVCDSGPHLSAVTSAGGQLLTGVIVTKQRANPHCFHHNIKRAILKLLCFS